jgi:sugar phosphate isomerase/epimerase
MTQTRREFIASVAAAGAALPFSKLAEKDSGRPLPVRFPLRLFSKPLDTYDFTFMCDCCVKAGIGGLDLTVRPGGKIEPKDAETALPKFHSDARSGYNLAVDMLVTGIVNTTDPFTEPVLKTASSLGIGHYRLGYLDFDLKTGIWESLQKYKADLVAVTELNKKYNIHGGYQNHAGARVGGPVWDLYELLKDLPPEFTGCQYDVRHAMVEGTNSWVLGMRLISSHIKTLAIKDFTWSNVKGRPAPVTVPMGEGMVNWDLFFRMVKELGITAPMTLHVEYPLLSQDEEKLSLSQKMEIIVRKIKKDVDFINVLLQKHQLT